ncbi:MAG: autotransporter-associated beta strand repeat-containing protein, partial [Bacteroidetes bacterium]|nr:autotransporter-associated beta strand repeat-containing protein [Bacteroidota bacterium]
MCTFTTPSENRLSNPKSVARTQTYSVAKAIAVNPNSQATSLLRRRAQLFLLLLIALLMCGMKGWGQTTVTYTIQTANFNTLNTEKNNASGPYAGTYNNTATEMAQYANGGSQNNTPGAAAFQTFTTTGNGTSGTARTLRVGDRFTITVYTASNPSAGGRIGISFRNTTSVTDFFSSTDANTVARFQLDNTGGWKIYNGGTTAENTGATSGSDRTLSIEITSSNTFNATIAGTTYYDLSFAAAGPIAQFCIYTYGDSNPNSFWKNGSLTNFGHSAGDGLRFGYGLSGSSTSSITGTISDGQNTNSTSGTLANVVFAGGSSGTAVSLSGSNTYTGATTVNANGTLRLGVSSTASSSGPLGTTAAGTSITSGGILDMNGYSLTSSATEALTINGTGISSGGALINTNSSTGSTWAGTVALGSASSVGGAGNLTLSGVVSGGFALTKIGAGTLTLSNTNTYSGGTVISAGTISASATANLGSDLAAGAITLGNGATTGTLDITSSLSRLQLNVTDASSAGVINVASGQTFTLTNLNTASGTNAGTKIGKSGAGTLTLSGAGTYVGQTQIGDGTVIVSNATGLGTNTSTANRSVDLGLNVGDVSQGNNVSLLLTNGVSINNSIYVAPNTSSATRTLGTSGATASGTLQNEIYLDGNVTCAPVTGGTLTISGKITGPASPSVGTSRLIASSGITTLTNTANDYKGTTTISSGAELRLNPSGNATCSTQVVLNGGTLSTTSITSTRTITSTSTLSLTASSTIALGSNGHTLTFAASNGVSWTSGQIITITGWAGTPGSTGTAGKIFVGNSSSGLTAGQLVQIFFSGVGPATILSTGEIVPATASTVQYRSRITGDWATAATWEHSTNGTDWAIAGKAPTSSDGAITILNGHTVTVSTAITADQLTINAGGQITVNGNTLTIANGTDTDITVNGTLKVSTNSVSLNASATMTVGSGGVYEHNRNFTLGLPSATWSDGSTCLITSDITSYTTFNQSFWNLTINFSTGTIARALNADASTFGVRNKLSIVATGTSGSIVIGDGVTAAALSIAKLEVSGGVFNVGTGSGAHTLTCSDSLIVSGGTFRIAHASNAGQIYTASAKDVLVSSGTLDLNGFNSLSTNSGRLIFTGNLTVSGGTLINSPGITSGSAGIYFNGTGTQTFTHSGGTLSTASGGVGRRFYYKTTSGPTALNETYSASTAQTTVDGTEGTAAAGYSVWPTTGSLINNVTVNNSAGVTLSTSKVVNGALTLTSGKLAIGANTLTLNGTVASMSASNSLTGSATSNLSIGGTGSLGTLFFDQTTNGTTNNLATLTLNRTSSGTATLGNAATVGTTLTLTNGILTTTSTNTLTVTSSASGAVSGGSASSYINGPLDRTVANATSYTFPIGGNTSNYRPISLNGVSASNTPTSNPVVRVTVAESGATTVDGTTLTNLLNARNWNIEKIGAPGTFTSATLVITESGMTNGTHEIGKSNNNQAGTYVSLGSATVSAGTITSPSAQGVGFYAIGVKPAVTNTITLGSNQPAAASQCPSTNRVVLQSFSLIVEGTGNLTNVGFTTTGTYVQADISKYQLWFSSTNDISGASQLGSDLSSSGGAGSRTFSAFTTPTLSNGLTYYFWITADVSSTTSGGTIAVNGISTADLTSTSTKSGSTTTAGGSQTLLGTPSTQASGIVFSNVTSGQMTISWSSSGNGDGVIVVMKAGSAPTDPTNATSYSASTIFGSGANISSDGSYVVLNGSGSNVTVTGLSTATNYFVEVFAKNCTGTSTRINTTSPASNSTYTLSTEPTSHTTLSATASSGAITLTYTAASGITNAAGYIILQRAGSAVTDVPVDGIGYSVGDGVGTNATVAA